VDRASPNLGINTTIINGKFGWTQRDVVETRSMKQTAKWFQRQGSSYTQRSHCTADALDASEKTCLTKDASSAIIVLGAVSKLLYILTYRDLHSTDIQYRTVCHLPHVTMACHWAFQTADKNAWIISSSAWPAAKSPERLVQFQFYCNVRAAEIK